LSYYLSFTDFNTYALAQRPPHRPWYLVRSSRI